MADDAVSATRLFQEHLNHEIAMAVASPDTANPTHLAPYLGPYYDGSDGGSPTTRYNRLTYRVMIGTATAKSK